MKDRPPCPQCKQPATQVFWQRSGKGPILRRRVTKYQCGSVGYANNYFLIPYQIRCDDPTLPKPPMSEVKANPQYLTPLPLYPDDVTVPTVDTVP
ncbi:unnamed protein product [marine sediment metagenome]|uniref:Uncharacterized protein n=1 Tax=marine sediment metagenome TaxID=412755 RepID=X1BQT4_9ZZZZ